MMQVICEYYTMIKRKTFGHSGAAEVRSLDFPRWYGSGVLHTKMLLVDGKHFYVGSANFDWRSLTQVSSKLVVQDINMVISRLGLYIKELDVVQWSGCLTV